MQCVYLNTIDEREKKLIRKAEFQEGVKAGIAQERNERTTKMLLAIRLIQQKCTAQEIQTQTRLGMETIQEMLRDIH